MTTGLQLQRIPSEQSDDAELISRYQELVRHSADVITLIDPSAVIEYLSPSAEAVLGYDQDALVGESVLEYVHPDDVERIRAEIASAVASPEGAVSQAEYRFRHADGSWIWLASVAVPRAGDDGFVVNSRDVTERREARAALEAERELYGSVVEGVNDAIAIHRQGEIVYANPQCTAMVGLEEDELIGRTLDSVVAPEDLDLVIERFRQRMDPEAPDPPARYEVRFETATGDGIVGEVNVTPIEYEGEEAILVAIRDVTERHEYESKLQARNEQLEALNRVVRHDIRNDMSVILGWAELLEEHLDEEGRDHLEKVLSSGRHVVELTEIARDFVETLTADAEPELRPVGLRSVLATEIDLAREFYPSASIEAVGELPAVEVAATEMLPSVFTNLLRNAVQHNPSPEPAVQVSATVEDGTAVVRVADDGPGVPDDAKERVFGKGEKGLESAGTGIGLYLVRTLVEQYGGEVHVEDNEPTGAVFVVRLPLAD